MPVEILPEVQATRTALREMAPSDVDAIIAQNNAPTAPEVAPLTPHEALTVDALYWGLHRLSLELEGASKHWVDSNTDPYLAKRVHSSAGQAQALLTVAQTLREAGR